MQFILRLFLLLLLLYILSCSTVPEIYLNDNVLYWKEYVSNKKSSDKYQNIYVFDNNCNIDLIIYGYKSKIKYKLFLMKEYNQAFYYKKYRLKNYIIESLPSFNLYQDTVKKNVYESLYKDFSYYISKNLPDTDIYLSIGLMVKDDNLYIAKNYGNDYRSRLYHWLIKNGYGKGKEWIPSINADWTSYPVPTEHEIDWNTIEFIGKLF